MQTLKQFWNLFFPASQPSSTHDDPVMTGAISVASRFRLISRREWIYGDRGMMQCVRCPVAVAMHR